MANQETWGNPHHLKLARYYVEEWIREYQPMPWRHLRLSSFGACFRAIALRLTTADHGQLKPTFIRQVCEEAGYEAFAPMLSGTRTHEHIQSDIQAAGIKLHSIEHELEYTYEFRPKGKRNKVKVKLVGHDDGMLPGGEESHPFDAGNHLFELKTFSHFRYQSWQRSTYWRDFRKELVQTQGYMNVSEHCGHENLSAAEIWGYNRSNGQFHIRYEKKDPVIFEAQLEAVGSVVHDLKHKRDKLWLPDPLPDGPGCSDCKLCDFKRLCWGASAQSFRKETAPLEVLP